MACVQYSDFLSTTLRAWQRWLWPDAELIVVTSHNDQNTHRLARLYGVDCVITDAWQRDDAIFNKAAALDVAFGFDGVSRPRPASGEICLAIDADVYPCGSCPDSQQLREHILYGCARYHCRTPADLARHLRGTVTRECLELMSDKALPSGYPPLRNAPVTVLQMATKCLGYFQLFRYFPGLQFGSWPTASKYDVAFRGRFEHKIGLIEPYVLHLGEQSTRNWQGRCVAPWPREVRA